MLLVVIIFIPFTAAFVALVLDLAINIYQKLYSGFWLLLLLTLFDIFLLKKSQKKN